jgi:hypothetical protein
MAARRLLIIMVILLAISTLAAALVPPPEVTEEGSTSSTATSTPDGTGKEPPVDGDLVRAEVAVPRGDQAPKRVEVAPGDQLELTVTSREPGEVSLPDFGLIEFAGPGNVATFDVLVEERGEFPVRFQGSGAVATVVARPAD